MRARLSNLPRRLPLLVTLTQSGTGVFGAESAGTAAEFGAAARVIFDIAHRVRFWCAAAASPAVADLDAPPERAFPAPADRRAERYYRLFHARVAACARSAEVRTGVDCHVFAPGAAPEDEASPAICISNEGDVYGEPTADDRPTTCSAELARDLREVAAARFADWPARVMLNQPVAGGYLIRRHASAGLPWVRLALSTALFTTSDGRIAPKRLDDLRSRLESILTFWGLIHKWR